MDADRFIFAGGSHVTMGQNYNVYVYNRAAANPSE